MAALIGLTFATLGAAPARADQPPRRRQTSAVIADAAEPGPRSFEALTQTFSRFVRRQPYGAHWSALLPKTKAPRSRRGRGYAKTHPALANDQAELQSQVQYLAPTKTAVAFGALSIRGVRVFRYGKLAAVQLVVDPVGRKTTSAEVARDRASLEQFLGADPAAALGLPKHFAVASRSPADSWPLRLELEPKRNKK